MLEMSVVHVPPQNGKAFHTRGPASEKLLSPKLLCVRGTTHILSEADRSWGRTVSAVSWILEARYDGVCPANDWWTRHASLNSTLRRTGSHRRWNQDSSVVYWRQPS